MAESAEPTGPTKPTEPDDAGRSDAAGRTGLSADERLPRGVGQCDAEPRPAFGRSLTGLHNSLARAFQSGRTKLRRRGAELGLGPGQPKLLVYLAVHGPTGQRELADYFETDPAAISRMTDALVRDGFVTSAPGHDRRTRVLAATDRGRAAAETWDRACAREEAVMLAGFTPEERTAFADYLTRVRANLRAAEEAGEASVPGSQPGPRRPMRMPSGGKTPVSGRSSDPTTASGTATSSDGQQPAQPVQSVQPVQSAQSAQPAQSADEQEAAR